MSVCYGFIVKKSLKTLMTKGVVGRRNVERRRVTIMCISLVTIFFICWFLYHFVVIVKQLSYFSLSVRISNTLSLISFDFHFE